MLPVQVGPSDTWEERAAIFEFEGGLPRPLAEALAHRLAYIVRRDGPAADASTLDGEMFEADRQRR